MLTPAHEPRIAGIGPACEHDILCWICGIRPAVYDMYPNWVFRPCWDCQKRLHTGLSWWAKFLLKISRLGIL